MSCFITHYASPLGRLLLAADEEGLTCLWLEGQKYFAAGLPQQREEQRTPALEEACCWLDTYFTGREPDFTPPLHPVGSDFQRAVWQLLLQIPYGQTTTYGALAGELARQRWRHIFRRRRWAAPWGITVFPLSPLPPGSGAAGGALRLRRRAGE